MEGKAKKKARAIRGKRNLKEVKRKVLGAVFVFKKGVMKEIY